jgi:hypothetical protein
MLCDELEVEAAAARVEGQRRRRHGRRRSSGSWSLARLSASGINLGTRLLRL